MRDDSSDGVQYCAATFPCNPMCVGGGGRTASFGKCGSARPHPRRDDAPTARPRLHRRRPSRVPLIAAASAPGVHPRAVAAGLPSSTSLTNLHPTPSPPLFAPNDPTGFHFPRMIRGGSISPSLSVPDCPQLCCTGNMPARRMKRCVCRAPADGATLSADPLRAVPPPATATHPITMRRRPWRWCRPTAEAPQGGTHCSGTHSSLWRSLPQTCAAENKTLVTMQGCVVAHNLCGLCRAFACE